MVDGLYGYEHRDGHAVLKVRVAHTIADRHEGLHGEIPGILEGLDLQSALLGHHIVETGPPEKRHQVRHDCQHKHLVRGKVDGIMVPVGIVKRAPYVRVQNLELESRLVKGCT